MSGSLSGSIEAEPSSRLFQAPSFTAATIFIADCVVVCCGVVHGVYYGLLARLVLVLGLRRCVCCSSARKCSAGGLVSTPASASFAYFASCCTAGFNQSSHFWACSLGSAVAADQREHFIEPWVPHSIAVVRNKLVDIRRRLRDCTSAIVPAAQGMPTKTSSGASCEGSKLAFVGLQGRAPRSCPECRDAE